MTHRLPHERPARVVITLDDGSTLQGEVGANRGDDALPYSRDELRAKFMDLTTRIWPADHAASVLLATLEFADDTTASLPRWTELLARAPQQ